MSLLTIFFGCSRLISQNKEITMSVDDILSWLSEYDQQGHAYAAVAIPLDDRWLALTTEEKLDMILVLWGQI